MKHWADPFFLAPEKVGRTESSGCFRLANWNAETLLHATEVGTPVIVLP